MFLYNVIGKTLLQISKECDFNTQGCAIFVLQNECDRVGIFLGEDLLVGPILKRHPEYAEYRVKYENDFFGQRVLRITKEDMQ